MKTSEDMFLADLSAEEITPPAPVRMPTYRATLAATARIYRRYEFEATDDHAARAIALACEDWGPVDDDDIRESEATDRLIMLDCLGDTDQRGLSRTVDDMIEIPGEKPYSWEAIDLVELISRMVPNAIDEDANEVVNGLIAHARRICGRT